jgi:exopolyphosphatase / guanosine-5'-triphosphate,3'-diphosphate pyrophosphatase
LSSDSTRFPLRVAAIDAGSNAIRFVAAEFVDPGHWVELEVQRVPVRLGHNVFLTGELDGETMRAAVETMATFRRAIDTHGIPRYRAVATSAVRESRNGGELVERIRRECGIQLETITGSEEARLVWIAVRHRVDLGEGHWLTADLGGGSLEVSLVSREGIHWSESHQMGTVRLLEDLGGAELDPERFLALAREYAGTLRIPDDVEPGRLAGMLATGGNIEALAGLMECHPDAQGVSRLPLGRLQESARTLAAMSVAERMAHFGLREDRADVIVPAALLYERVAVLAGVDEILVPHVGVKEGLLLDLAEDLAGPGVHASRLEQQAFHGALALGRRFHFDEPHARHVGRLVLSLFDQLRDLHGLGEADRRILLVAAVLHDVGQFVSYRRHHKHSLYLIQNSDVPNVSSDERALVALVARYHRRADPHQDHYLYQDLRSGNRLRVRKLAALLRIADALDREHLQRVAHVRAERVDGELVLHVEGHGDLLLEQWAFRRKARMFSQTFEVDVRLALEESALGPGVI